MRHRVVFSPRGRDDLIAIYTYIAQASGEHRAIGFVGRIEAYCRGLADFPARGARRDDLSPGLRVTGFERRVSIAFHIADDTVTIDRSLHGGRDLAALRDED